MLREGSANRNEEVEPSILYVQILQEMLSRDLSIDSRVDPYKFIQLVLFVAQVLHFAK